MLTLLTYLGSGFAFAVGLFVGVVLTGRAVKSRTDSTAKSEALLAERNEIGRKQVTALERIADRLDDNRVQFRSAN